VLVNLSTMASELVRFQAGTPKKEDQPAKGEADIVMNDVEEL